ncbi:MAG: Omp28 family outer membrane lipoprotein [Bacteroidales bacterium]|jgi:thiol-disulfide isomerase/thioredoxin|nr:Omp28 family outer membrane lipoprotein [Bacteroidales bacterium]
MKKILLILIGLFTTIACDRIPEDSRWTSSDKLPDWNGQYVLLEDFTGVQCVNCPAAAEEIERLKEKFGDKLIVVGLHPQTNLNEPISMSPDTNGNNLDLRNDQANEYHSYYNKPPLPVGIVMQKNQRLSKDNFYGSVLSYYTRKASAEMSVEAKFVSNSISINTDISFIDNYTGSGNTQLSLMILEDSLLVVQQTPSGYIRNYRQDHVLRAMATPIWGDEITGSNTNAGSNFSHSQTIEINAEWRLAKLSVVAILFDNNTKEVIQCATAKILNE